MSDLKNALEEYLEGVKNDQGVVDLIQRIKILQTNGIQIREAIRQACRILGPPASIHWQRQRRHNDNALWRLVSRHRAKILRFRSEGYGYGQIAKLLAQRGAYNKQTGKAFSRATIQRACNLLEKEGGK